MTLGLQEGRARRRRQFRFRILKWLFVIALIVTAGYYAWHTGKLLAAREVTKLREEIADLRGQIAGLEKEKQALALRSRAAVEATAAWKKRYDQEVPQGALRDLVALTQTRLDQGLDPSRLRFVIETVSAESRCDNEPVSKRFFVRTALHKGGNDSVSFAENRITITARGESGVDAEGNREAPFDPAEPIEVRFSQLGGGVQEKSGVLPLHHSEILGDNEYRFTLVAGDRGILKVTGDRCDYP